MNRESTMLNTFRSRLAAMSPGEFKLLWDDIKEQNKDVVGPTANELIASFRPQQEEFIRRASQSGTLGEPLSLAVLLGVQHREGFLDELDTLPGILDTVQAAILEAANGQDLTLDVPVCDKPAYAYNYVRIVGLTAEGSYRVESVDGEPLERPMLYTDFRPKTLIAVYREFIGLFETGDQTKAYAD